MSPSGVCGALFISLLLVAPSSGQDQDVCRAQKTCGTCVTTGANCTWCMGRFDDLTNRRCDYADTLIERGCMSPLVVNPDHEINNIRNEAPRDGAPGRATIQLAPQEVKVKLRPNKPFKMNVRYRQAENYPVDLYVVMDLSASMRDHKVSLEQLTDLLAEALANITTNYRFGFGSFIDKTTPPFISIRDDKLVNPCRGSTCAPPYGFRNDLSLTPDKDEFKRKVGQAPVSGNLDAVEGGFDGLMQAVVCTEEIDWATAARKLLLYVSDQNFHMALDGKLAGIVKPNDGLCHLDASGMYTESVSQDYPSISHLNLVIAEKKINVIFAVTKNKKNVHIELAKLVEGSAVALLGADSNVVDLVKENYNKISSTVELKTTQVDGIYVSFKSRCGGGELETTSRCDGIKIGEEVTFEMMVQATECPSDPAEREKYFRVSLVGLGETLDVNISLICDCPCEKPDFEPIGNVLPPQANSSECGNRGTFNCGACSCDSGNYGPTCQCSGAGGEDDYDTSTCRRTNDSLTCEGRGQCTCGACNCYPIIPTDTSRIYSGAFCECNDYSCDATDGKLCGGPEQGRCRCGRCQCSPNYQGDNCECPIAAESCRSGDGLMCSGKGSCTCGSCVCDSPYTGQTCEDCPSCPGRCEPNKHCVQCATFESGIYGPEDCAANCSHVTVVDELKELPDRKLCKFRDEDGCDFFFTYEYYGTKVEAQRTKECPEKVDILKIVLGCIGAIVAAGLIALIIWKVYVTVHDKKEYERFQMERAKAKWEKHDNPLYESATVTSSNPALDK